VIVADTNVLSEPLRKRPDPAVLAWLSQHRHELTLTTITVSELLYGAHRLRAGRRREELLAAIEELIRDSRDRLLGFDEAAARMAASLRVARARVGAPVSTEDLMIAAIARANGASVATRNVAHFDGFSIEVVNPWMPTA
jgi:predicted nucleic acid-binding protein